MSGETSNLLLRQILGMLGGSPANPAPAAPTNTLLRQILERLVAMDAAGVPAVTWASLTGKPAAFPPEAHTQDWSTITGKPATFPPSAHTQDWTTITGTPATFPPSAHTHPEYTECGVDTRANIILKNPVTETVKIWLASDSHLVYWTDGAAWHETPFAQLPALLAPAIGLHPWPSSGERIGYATDAITDKRLSNCSVGDNQDPREGAMRVLNGVVAFYLLGGWKDVVTGFRFRERGTRLSLEIKPTGTETWIDITTGDSLDSLGLNGRPLVHNWTVDIGPYPRMTPCRIAQEPTVPLAAGAEEGETFFAEDEDMGWMRDSYGSLLGWPMSRLPSGCGIVPQLVSKTITGYTGGGATKLDGIAVTPAMVGTELKFYVGGLPKFARLDAGTDAEDVPAGIIRPDNYAGGTNECVWRLVG